METVKVDVQKLQLLNDRIAQTIDALNQLRMSVHGIQHTPATPYGHPYAGGYTTPSIGYTTPFTPFGTQFGTQFGSPFGGPQFGGSPYGTPFTGIQHTTTPFLGTLPHAVSPVTTPLGGWTMPYLGNGISHTTMDPTSWQMRTGQAWPFSQWVPSTVTGA